MVKGLSQKMTFNEFMSFCKNSELVEKRVWRLGQMIFNSLCTARPKLAEDIIGSIKDPFHRNENDLKDCAEFIKERWDYYEK